MNPGLPVNIFDANMQVLKRRFPEVHANILPADVKVPFAFRPVKTSSGQTDIAATLGDGSHIRFYGDTDICGQIAAQMADWQLVAGDFLFCVGIGLGYLPLSACRQFAGQPRIVVIEPHPEIMRLALQSVDLRPLLDYEGFDLFVGPGLSAAEIISGYGEKLFFGKNRLVSHGPSRLIYGQPFAALEGDIVDNIRLTRNIGYTAKIAGKQIFANTMANLCELFSGPDLGSLKGCFAGCPAICVAAGPSLDKDLETLKSVGHRALILCADSAVRSLVNAGITPHVVVTTDTNPVNFEKLRTSLDRLRGSVLVFSIEANPDNVRTFLGQRRIAVTSQSAVLNHWLGSRWSLDWRLPAMTSVSHTAMFTALALGADPIILVGMDFAYADGKSHASGSVFRYPSDPSAAIAVDGVRGYPVNALPQLITDRKQIENALPQIPARVVDTSLDGALIRGAENRSLAEVVATMLSDNTDVPAILNRIDWRSSVPAEAVLGEISRMTASIDHFIDACQVNGRWCLTGSPGLKKTATAQNVEQSLTGIKKRLMAFEKENRQLLHLLKLVRYEDVKAIANRLQALRTPGHVENDPAMITDSEREIYADHYRSLEAAARHFRQSLAAITDYLTEASQHIRYIAGAPDSSNRILELARCHARYDCIHKAESAYLRHLDNNPEDVSAWIELGRMFAQKRLWGLAQVYLRQVQSRFPDQEAVQSLQADIAQAIAALRIDAAASMDAGNPQEARMKLYEYHTLRDKDDGSRGLEQAIADHDRTAARAMRSDCPTGDSQRAALDRRIRDLLESGAIEPALGILEGLAWQNTADKRQVREKIGDIRLSQGDRPSAGWHYRQALALGADSRELASKLDLALEPETKPSDQEKTMNKSMRDDSKRAAAMPDNAVEMYRQAQAQSEEQDYTQAISILESLLKRYPEFALAHNDLGVLYFNEGMTDVSFSHYREAVRLEPHNPVFQKNLADFYYFVNQEVQPAIAIYVELLEKNPEDREVLLALGQICMQQARRDDAAVFYRRILELEPTNSDALMGLAALAGR